MPSKEDRAWQRYVQDFRTNALQKIVGSAACLTLYTGDGTDFDVKQATELGAILLLDKPLILVVMQGCTPPTRLTKAADVILEDFNLDDIKSNTRLREAIQRFTE